MKWKDLTLAAVDVETTGLDPEVDKITEVGIVVFKDGEIIDRYSQLVNPEMPIPPDSTKITGITDEDVADSPVFVEIVDEILKRLENRAIVAYNLDFDRAMLTAELERVGKTFPPGPYLDPYVFAWSFYKHLHRRNLGAIAKELKIPLTEAHRAAADAEVAGRIMLAFADKLPDDLKALEHVQARWKIDSEKDRRHWKSKRKEIKFQDGILGEGKEQLDGLGAPYIYGTEPDPLRALYNNIPDCRD